MQKLSIKNLSISITGFSNDDYISLTDIARFKNPVEPKDVIKNWIRTKSTIEYLGIWEFINNKNFKRVDFDSFRIEAGSNYFTMSPERWTVELNGKAFIVKRGRYNGGTFAHKDIALDFAMWVSPEIKFLVIKEVERLKEEENKRIDWAGKRQLSSLNYLLQTDAKKKNIIQIELKSSQISYIYASEADVINVALFGVTANEWKKTNPQAKGNIRDYVNIIELTILSNLELLNSKLIEKGINQSNRLILLNEEANKEKSLFVSYKPELLR